MRKIVAGIPSDGRSAGIPGIAKSRLGASFCNILSCTARFGLLPVLWL
jgi:hypothetical protein